jgi:hypothetical protein
VRLLHIACRSRSRDTVPTGLNDARNGHLHGLIGTRRVMIDAEGRLIRDNDGNLLFEACKVPEVTSRAFPKALRCTIAHFINIELERLEADHRISPESYSALKIDADPQAKLRGEQTVLSRAGVVTADEQDNVLEGWRRKFAELAEQDTRELACKQAEERRRCEAIDARGLSEWAWDVGTNLSTLAWQKQREAARLRHEERQIRLLIEMATSRPELVMQFAPAYAEKATKRSRYDADGWREREAEAQHYRAALLQELEVEQLACIERNRKAAALEEEAEATLARLESEIAYAATSGKGSAFEPVPVPLPEPVSTPDVERQLSSSEIDALVEAIRTEPLRLVRVEGRFRLDPRDDAEGRYATGLFDSAAMQTRLAAIQKTREAMPSALAAWIAKHPGQNAERAAPKFIAELARVWRLTRPDEEGAGKATSGPKQIASSSSRPVPSPPAAEQSGMPLREAMELATHSHAASQKRAATLLNEEVQRLIRPQGQLGAMALGFLTELGARPELYSSDGETLVCRYRGGDRETGFNLLMQDAEVAELALALHGRASLRPHGSIPAWLSDLVEAKRHNPSLAWMRAAAAPSDRFLERLPELLAARPSLSRSPAGVSLSDEAFVQSIGSDASGLYATKVQHVLEAAYRIQEEERADCLAMVASGQVKVKVLIKRAPEFHLKIANDDASTELPDVFTRFEADPAFAEECLLAKRTGQSAQTRSHRIVRAWQRASAEQQPTEVLRAIADELWKEPKLKEILTAINRDLAWDIAKSVSRTHEIGWLFPKPRRRASIAQRQRSR